MHALARGLDRANAGFSLERAKRHPRVCDVMKIEPFGKPAVWMYQFWQQRGRPPVPIFEAVASRCVALALERFRLMVREQYQSQFRSR